MNFSDVKAIAAAAEAEARRNQWAVCIAIVDDGGHLLHLQRLDGAAPISSHIAPAKANTAALGRRESKVYEDMVNGGRVSFMSAPVLQGMLEGGVAIMVDGQCLGAVGVSGVKSTEDARDRHGPASRRCRRKTAVGLFGQDQLARFCGLQAVDRSVVVIATLLSATQQVMRCRRHVRGGVWRHASCLAADGGCVLMAR